MSVFIPQIFYPSRALQCLYLSPKNVYGLYAEHCCVTACMYFIKYKKAFLSVKSLCILYADNRPIGRLSVFLSIEENYFLNLQLLIE